MAVAAAGSTSRLEQGARNAGLQAAVATGGVVPPLRQACDAPRCRLVGERCEPKRDADLMHREGLKERQSRHGTRSPK